MSVCLSLCMSVSHIQASAKPALHSASQQQTKLKGRLDECDGQITLLSELLAVRETLLSFHIK